MLSFSSLCIYLSLFFFISITHAADISSSISIAPSTTTSNNEHIEHIASSMQTSLISSKQESSLSWLQSLTRSRSKDTNKFTTLATPVIDSEEQKFITLINNYRISNNLVPLQVSVTLTNACDWHGQDMGTKNYFSHTDSLGRDPFVRMVAFGYCNCGWRGENIAAGNALAADTFAQWKNSPGHNANMLNSNFRIMGLSRVYVAGSRYRYYWMNNFGSSIDTTIPPPTTTTQTPTTAAPTTAAPTTKAPTKAPTTAAPTTAPSTAAPTTATPTTAATTIAPTTAAPTTAPSTAAPTTAAPSTAAPTTVAPTAGPTTAAPTTVAPTTAAPTTVAPTTVAPVPVLDSEERAFITLINDYRAANNLTKLQVSVTLTRACDWHGQDMGTKNYFDHTDSLGRDPFVRMVAFGYCNCGWRGENIAAGNALATDTFQQWKNSPGHNSNMLGVNFRIMGISRVYVAGSTYRYYWMNNFGSVVDATIPI